MLSKQPWQWGLLLIDDVQPGFIVLKCEDQAEVYHDLFLAEGL
jgi:hypothetical protein